MFKDKSEMTNFIKMKGLELGFTNIGITTADDFTEYEEEVMGRPDYVPWIKSKLAYQVGIGARPKEFFPSAKSIICATYNYGDILYPENISKYVAYGYLSREYNPLQDASCGVRAEAFSNYLKSIGCNVYTGDVAVPARMACARAGITTYGKNNFAYTNETGSFVLLYTFVVDRELDYDEPTVECKCPPDCDICIKACPTKAIVAPGRLSPMKCLLLNHFSPNNMSEEIREATGTYIHGCDICQKACPRNKKVLEKASRKDPFLEKLDKLFDIEKVLLLEEDYYESVIHPIMHNYINDFNLFRRNAAIAIGNTKDPVHLPALKEALERYDDPQVRDAVLWAIDRIENSK